MSLPFVRSRVLCLAPPEQRTMEKTRPRDSPVTNEAKAIRQHPRQLRSRPTRNQATRLTTPRDPRRKAYLLHPEPRCVVRRYPLAKVSSTMRGNAPARPVSRPRLHQILPEPSVPSGCLGHQMETASRGANSPRHS